MSGVLKGWDNLVNLVLDDAVEYLRDPLDRMVVTNQTRPLGRVVCRSSTVLVIAPTNGYESISNPFVEEEQ